MGAWPENPVVYEINTWAWLDELRRTRGQSVTLGCVPQDELERVAGFGFDAVWLMGVWQRSPAGRKIARQHPDLQAGYRQALSDFSSEDVVGSPYAVYRYAVDPALGGDAELAALRQRLQRLGLLLVLDFVPNHVAVDHHWVMEHPQRLVQGSPADLERAPRNYFRAEGRVFAHGRDPTFPGWSDTVQLDYRRPGTRSAMADLLHGVAQRCDGVRCDMAMLVTRDVFLQTWGGAFEPPEAEFWPRASAEVKANHPGFVLMAEVYWDLEYELQQMGFDYTYDKRLYDRLLGDRPRLVSEHLRLASLDYQRRLVRFIENHDEERAVTAFGLERSRAAAVVALTLPGARLVHEGQLEGRRLRLPVQLGRRATEAPEASLQRFYEKLLLALNHPVLHWGQWRALPLREAWVGNATHGNIVAHRWVLGDEHRLVVANLASGSSQGYVAVDLPAPAGGHWVLEDLLSEAAYHRDGHDLLARGLYLDLPGYGYHLFRVRSEREGSQPGWPGESGPAGRA